MHGNQVIWHEENIGTMWKTSHRCCIMRKVARKDVTPVGSFNFSGICGNIENTLKDEICIIKNRYLKSCAQFSVQCSNAEIKLYSRTNRCVI